MPFLSKILEKVVSGEINEHLLINNLHAKFQSVYITGFSTETAKIKITDIFYALDNKSYTALIIIEMSTAFDTVNLTILLKRLSKCFEIKNTAFSCFK